MRVVFAVTFDTFDLCVAESRARMTILASGRDVKTEKWESRQIVFEENVIRP